MGDLSYVVERVDAIKSGELKTEYYVAGTVYDSLEILADWVVRSLTRVSDVERILLYRANIRGRIVNARSDELPELCEGNPAINITRGGSRVINASGDGDYLLVLQGLIAERMS